MRGAERNRGFGVVLALAWAVLVFLLLPGFVTVPFSLTPERYLSLPTAGVSLQHYINLVTNEKWVSSIVQSLAVASLTTLFAVLLGTLCAIGLWRLGSRWSEHLRSFILLPLIVPAVVSAIAFYRLFVWLGLLDTYPGIVLAHTILAAPFVVITVSTSLANFDPQLERAARGLGATLAQTVRRVILPAIAPGVLAGAVFSFITSWDELVVTLFITSLRVFTLPRRMWDGIREHIDPTIAAAATSLLLLTLVGIVCHLILARRRAVQMRKERG